MSHLSLSFLGQFRVSRDGQAIDAFGSEKAQALLAYLATDTRVHQRNVLTALLWPHYRDDSARTNLRQALHRLRQAIGEENAEADKGQTNQAFILSTRETLQLNPESSHNVDIQRFTELVQQCERHVHAMTEPKSPCVECLERMSAAVELYRGEFLEGFSVADSLPFEEWRRLTQERLHLQVVELLQTLSVGYSALAQHGRAYGYVSRWVSLEPYSEVANRQMMAILLARGDRHAALEHFQSYRLLLAAELKLEPQADTIALYESIRTQKTNGVPNIAPKPAPTSDANPSGRAVEMASVIAPPFGVRALVEKPLSVVPPLVVPPSSSRHNLPAYLVPFVGREHELATIETMLRQSNVRLLTLIGPGGMGKTRLAVEVARAQLGKFADGVFFVSLAPLAEAVSIPSAIAATLGLSLRGGDPKDALIAALRDKHLLLVLDNFEHVLDGSIVVVELLQLAAQVNVIVTSRERLNVRGENIYIVPGMAYQGEHVQSSPAVRLFAQSARGVNPSFDLSETNLRKVLRLCQLLDGLPLGLELAAAWIEIMPLDTIVAEIERSADFLTSNWRDAPPRQRSLRGVFDWSWRLLNEGERTAYRRLSVFRGGFTLEAAQAVVGASFQILKSLSDKSLLRTMNDHDQSRYDVHELLRQFAALELDAVAGEREGTEARHSQFYMAFAIARENRLKQYHRHDAIAEFRTEIDNFRQAWGWAVAHVRLEEIYAVTHTVWLFYQAAAPLLEQERIFGLAVESLQNAIGVESTTAAEALSIQQVLSKLLAYYARTLNAQGRHQLSLPLAQQAVQLGAASAGMGGIEGEAMGNLVWGQALSRMSQPEEAHQRLERALQLAQHHMRQHAPTEPLLDTEWIAYIWLSTNALALNKPYLARDYLSQGQRVFLSPNNPRGETTYLLNHADVDMVLGEYDGARQKLEQTLRIARQSSLPWAEGVALVNLGKIGLHLGEYSAAAENLHQAQKVMHEMGDAWQQVQALAWLARLHTCMGAYVEAAGYLQQLTDRAGSMPSPEVRFLFGFASAYLGYVRGDYENALDYAQQAKQAAVQAHNRANIARANILVGHNCVGLGQLAQAADAYQQALFTCRELDNARLSVEPLAGFASIALAQHDPSALNYVEEVLRVLVEYPRAGLDDPFNVYLACYRVLHAYNDPRALPLRQTAQQLLKRYSEQIHNEALRRSFELNVPTHRALLP